MSRAILVLSCLAVVLPAVADQPVPASDAVARELAGIRESLDRLAGLLQESRAHRRAELLLRRIERRETRLAAQEGRLRSARSSLESEQDQRAQFDMYREQMEQEIRSARERGDPGIEDQVEKMIRQAELEDARIKDKIETLESRIRELEDQVADGRRAIEDLDLRLEQILALLDDSD